MTSPIPLNLAVEDALTESLFAKILATIPTAYATRTIYTVAAMDICGRTSMGLITQQEESLSSLEPT
jgi:hypothetical protein